MRLVIQRVSSARVRVDGETVGEIGPGLVALAGIGKGDTAKDADYLAEKLVGLRVFEDDAGKINLSVQDTKGSLLIVSQFTLYGDVRKGRRPAFDRAAPPDEAKGLFDYFVSAVSAKGVPVATGRYRAHMQVTLEGDGPVTILLDTEKTF